jgi:hypothetical protein
MFDLSIRRSRKTLTEAPGCPGASVAVNPAAMLVVIQFNQPPVRSSEAGSGGIRSALRPRIESESMSRD